MAVNVRRGPVGWLLGAFGALLLLAANPVHAQSSDAAGAAQKDPLAIYYGNTIVCGLTHSGNDLCHVWFYPKGKMIIFDQGGAHPAHYKVFSYRKTGTISVCMYWNDDHQTQPADMIAPPSVNRGPMPTMAGKDPGRYCANDATGRTTCHRVPDVSALPADQQALAHDTMGQRWNQGMCYPYREDIKPGAVYLEWDDPAPSQDGGDKVWFIAGHH